MEIACRWCFLLSNNRRFWYSSPPNPLSTPKCQCFNFGQLPIDSRSDWSKSRCRCFTRGESERRDQRQKPRVPQRGKRTNEISWVKGRKGKISMRNSSLGRISPRRPTQIICFILIVMMQLIVPLKPEGWTWPSVLALVLFQHYCCWCKELQVKGDNGTRFEAGLTESARWSLWSRGSSSPFSSFTGVRSSSQLMKIFPCPPSPMFLLSKPIAMTLDVFFFFSFPFSMDWSTSSSSWIDHFHPLALRTKKRAQFVFGKKSRRRRSRGISLNAKAHRISEVHWDAISPSNVSTLTVKKWRWNSCVEHQVANSSQKRESLSISPIGMPGELWIGNEGLTLCSHHRLDLTRENFLAQPFW